MGGLAVPGIFTPAVFVLLPQHFSGPQSLQWRSKLPSSRSRVLLGPLLGIWGQPIKDPVVHEHWSYYLVTHLGGRPDHSRSKESVVPGD